ncbi:hypothetical protein J2Y02_002267 [Neobacillus drentensis]|nr:hypothetical protein [Neobacillus drentensis]
MEHNFTSDAPMLLAERILSSSTKSTPVIVLMITIKKVAYMIKKIFDCSLIPNQSLNNVIKARGGMKRTKLIIGSSTT